MRALIEKLDGFVTQKNLNRSEVRAKILETIVFDAQHFRAQDLLEPLFKRYPSVGKATLYRTLPILVESGILQEGPTDLEGQKLYELAGDAHHDHIVCLDCNGIYEFHDDAIEKKQAHISHELGFTAQSHRHVIYASCDFLKRKQI